MCPGEAAGVSHKCEERGFVSSMVVFFVQTVVICANAIASVLSSALFVFVLLALVLVTSSGGLH